MKIAHLILCHANPAQLQRLILRLVHPDAAFYIHMDLKADITPFLLLKEIPNVYFVRMREKVYWGGYSIVQATINGFAEIVASGIAYDYINLLSGQDYPLVPVADIHSFLGSSTRKAYMHTLSVLNEWHEAIPRVTQYHLANMDFAGKYRTEQLLNKILPRRSMPFDMEAVGRSQWFTIPLDCAAYIVAFLKQNPKVARFFKLTWAPDEIIFQTILHNSHFKNQMVNDNLRYIDWSAGGASPKLLTMEDKNKLMTSGKFFARKFSAENSAILDYIDTAIAHQENAKA
jgi:hypothetical protein